MGLIVGKVSVIFIYIGIGFVCNKFNVLPLEANKPLIDLMLTVTTPALMVSSIVTQKVGDDTMKNTVIVFLFALLFFALTAFLSSLIAAKGFRMNDPTDGNVLAVAMTSCNSGFIGFPVTRSVFGPLALFYMVVSNITLNLYLFIIAIIQLNFGTNKKSAKFTFRALIKPFMNVVTITSVIAVIMLFAGITLPKPVLAVSSSLGECSIPLSMMVVGVQLGESDMKHILSNARMLVTDFVKLIAFPALCLGIVMLLPIDNLVKLTLVLSTCFPTAVLSVAIAEKEGRNATLMAEAVASTTFFSMFTMPVWILLISRMFPF